MGAEELIDDELYEDEDIENEESYDSSSSYSYQPNNGNKFFNNPNNRRKKNDDDSSKGNIVPFRKPTSVSKETSNLNKKVRSQAKEKPKQVNLSKPSSKNPKDFLKNSVNKAKNKMQAIHDNKKAKIQQNNNSDADNKKNPIEQVGDEAAKKALSAALQYYRVPKAVADKLVEKYGDKAIDFVKKTTIITTVIAIAPVILLLLLLISSGLDEDSDDSNATASSYISGTMTDKEFYDYLVENDMVDDGACLNSNDTFNPDCDAIKYFKKIKDNVNNSEQLLTIYHVMAYERNDDVYALHDSEELDSLLENKDNLKEYINGDYLTQYRTEFAAGFDLYSEIEEDVVTDVEEEVFSDEFSIDSNTGFKMRIGRAKRENTLFYEKNPSDLEGECVWYVLGRANEILDDWGVKTDWTYGPNGGEFCNTSYSKNYDIDKIQQGSIISWKYGPYGHVAIVEKVNKGSDGLVQSIVITEGGLGYYNFGEFLVGNSDNFVFYNGSVLPVEQENSEESAPRTFVNKEGGGGTYANKQRRMALCESHGTGCQNSQTLTRDNIESFNGQNVTRFCTIPLSQLK